jgi:hypothetical protein
MPKSPLPRWAVLPAAGKLVASSLRHPNSGKAVYIDRSAHTVAVEPIDGVLAGNGSDHTATVEKRHSKA